MPSSNASSSADTTQPEKEEDLHNLSLQIHKHLMIFNCLILPFLQIKYQFSKISPFESHEYPFIISFITFTLIYFILHLSEMKLQHVPEIRELVGNISHIFGAIATILLLSIISPVFALFLMPFVVVWFAAIAYSFYNQFFKPESSPGNTSSQV